MNNANPTGMLGRHKPVTRKGWRANAWAVGLFLAWLALLAVPVIGLCKLDALAPLAEDARPKPWMPAYTPII